MEDDDDRVSWEDEFGGGAGGGRSRDVSDTDDEMAHAEVQQESPTSGYLLAYLDWSGLPAMPRRR